ncbi:MAG: hypothetical protein QME79_08105 [Bacillota bacterium]|nr:hypothetical protein [Bacillota bacterium]
MVRGREVDGVVAGPLKARVRLDYKGRPQPYRLFVGAKRAAEAAAENREREVSLLRNIPLQGLRVLEVDSSAEVYQVHDVVTGEEVAYAPVTIELEADSIEDLIRFILREEFRKIEVLEPAELLLTHYDAERFLYRMGEELKQQINLVVRRLEAGH